MSPARRCASSTSGRDCTALRKRSSQSASCCEVRISTKKQLSSPSFSGSRIATSALMTPEALHLADSVPDRGLGRAHPAGDLVERQAPHPAAGATRMFRSRSSSAAAIPCFPFDGEFHVRADLRAITGRFPYLKRGIETLRENVLSSTATKGAESRHMRHYPGLPRSARPSGRRRRRGRRSAVAKLRLLLKTEARDRGLRRGAVGRGPRPGRPRGGSRSSERAIEAGDAVGAALVYGANGDAEADARGRRLRAGPPGRWSTSSTTSTAATSSPRRSSTATRSTVAIGTEGAAPVLARKIKAEVEAMLPATLGPADPDRAGRSAHRVEALRFAGAPRVLDALLLRARPAGRCEAGEDGGARRARADARRGRSRRGAASSTSSAPAPATPTC